MEPAWRAHDDRVARRNQRVVAITGNGYWYPNPRHGYYVKGGFGVTRYKQWSHDENDEDVTTGLTTNGLAGHIGTGDEVRVNPRMSLVGGPWTCVL